MRNRKENKGAMENKIKERNQIEKKRKKTTRKDQEE